jgi:phosphohistidine phosphatase
MGDLYLIRHGLAGQFGDYPDDTQRPLTAEGREKTQRLASRWLDLGLQFDLILTSPLQRAQDTAQILLSAGLSEQLETLDCLAPEGELATWLDWAAQLAESRPNITLALVGHEPNLSQWAELLIWGECRGRIVLKKAGAIGLHLPETGSPIGNSHLFWLTPPRLLL